MKELDAAIKTVVEGLRSIAKSVEKIAEKLEKSTPKKKTKSKPTRKTEAKPARKATAKLKKPAPKKAPTKKAVTAADTVLAIINRSKKGVDSATLAKKTGFDKKKLANIVFKLRKQGKIKSVGRGVYKKA